MNNKSKTYLTQTSKYLSNELPLATKIWFSLKYRFNPKLKQEIIWLKEIYSKINLINTNKNMQFDTGKAWLKLQERIKSEHAVEQRQSTFTFRYSYIAAAASLLVLVALSVSVWFYYNPTTITLANMAQSNTIIRILPDGTQVFVGQNTVLEYPKRFVGKTRTVKLNGEAYFDVVKNHSKPFIINTSHADIRVVGTSFNLKASNEQVQLKVTEGKVRITLAANQKSALVQAGEAAIASKNDIITYIKPTAETVKSTMKVLMFQDETMDDIVRVINSTYGSNIKVLGDDLKTMRISVTFDNDISSIVNILSASFNLKVTRSPDGSIIISR